MSSCRVTHTIVDPDAGVIVAGARLAPLLAAVPDYSLTRMYRVIRSEDPPFQQVLSTIGDAGQLDATDPYGTIVFDGGNHPKGSPATAQTVLPAGH